MRRLLAALLALLPATAAAQYPLSGSQWDLLRHVLVPPQIEMDNGSSAAPSYSFLNDTGSGMYRSGSGKLAASVGGSFAWQFTIQGQIDIGGINVSSGSVSTTTINGANAASGRTDTGGGNSFWNLGRGTGTAAGGNWSLSVAPADTSSGSSQNTLQTVIFVSGTDGTIGIGGVDYKGTASATNSLTLRGVDRTAGVTDGNAGGVLIAGGLPTGTGNLGPITMQLGRGAATTGSSQATHGDVEKWTASNAADPQDTTITLTANNGGTMVRKAFSEELTLSTGGTTTDTSANLLPANAIILAVATRVTTTISGGGVTAFSVGDATTAARFSASAGGLSAGSTRVGLQQQQGSVATDAAGPVQASAAKVRITTDATPSAGKVRICVWALVFTAPSS